MAGKKRKARNLMRGGPVRGPGTATSDSILARVSNGEYVLPKAAVDLAGVQNLEALRRAALARPMPGYALGGEVDQYGNDLSLTNRMNAGADLMASWRAPAAQAQPSQQPMGLSALFGPNPQQQAQDAYKTARGNADPLDVASGRFDREYQPPRFAAGGPVGLSSAQWERLPRFAQGMSPEDIYKSKREEAQRIMQGIGNFLTSPVDTSKMPGSQFPRFNEPKQTVSAPPAPVPTSARIPSATPLLPIQPNYYDVSVPVSASALRINKAANYPNDNTISNLGDVQSAKDIAERSARSLGVANNPGRSLLDVNAVGLPNTPIFTGKSKQVGTAQIPDWGNGAFDPSQGTPTLPTIRGGSATENPVYQTPYYNQSGQPIATITGSNQRVGGGTVSQPNQGNGGTVEGNVAALNRQIDALRSLREAQNPGITTGASASVGPLVAVGTPGGNYGDEAMRANRAQSLLEQATAPGRTFGGKARRQAALQAGLALLAPPPQERGQAQPSGLNPYQYGQLQQGLADLGLKQQQAQFERQKWETEQQRNERLANSTIALRNAQAQPKPQAPMTTQQQLGQLQGAIYNAYRMMQGARTPEELSKAKADYNGLLTVWDRFNPPANFFNTLPEPQK